MAEQPPPPDQRAPDDDADQAAERFLARLLGPESERTSSADQPAKPAPNVVS